MAPTVAGRISDGVPPPKKMLPTLRPGASSAQCAQLAQVGGEEARLVDAARAHMAVEVAVGALGGAERPMHVDAEAGVHVSPRRAAEAGCGEQAEGAGAVGDRMLGIGLHLAEGQAVAVGDEHRIIAETSASARRPDQMAVNLALERLRPRHRARPGTARP